MARDVALHDVALTDGGQCGQCYREIRGFTVLACNSASSDRATLRPQKRSRVVDVKAARMKSSWQQLEIFRRIAVTRKKRRSWRRLLSFLLVLGVTAKSEQTQTRRTGLLTDCAYRGRMLQSDHRSKRSESDDERDYSRGPKFWRSRRIQ